MAKGVARITNEFKSVKLYVLFCSLAVLDRRVGHIVDVRTFSIYLCPFVILILCTCVFFYPLSF